MLTAVILSSRKKCIAAFYLPWSQACGGPKSGARGEVFDPFFQARDIVAQRVHRAVELVEIAFARDQRLLLPRDPSSASIRSRRRA